MVDLSTFQRTIPRAKWTLGYSDIHKDMVVYCVVFILMPVFATHLLFQIAPWLSSSSVNDGHCGQSKLYFNRWPKMALHCGLCHYDKGYEK